MKQVIEKELKLAAPPDFAMPVLPGQAIEPRRFTSAYFDTQDLRLAKASITLRRRVENRKGMWQLKLPKSDGRLEIEEPGGPGGPPPAMLALLTGVLRGDSLAPIARIRTARSGFVAQHDERRLAEVVFDRFQVMKGSTVEATFHEVEIELLDGSHSDLKDLELILLRAGATRGDSRPKVFQALGLHPAKTQKAPRSASELAHLQWAIASQLDNLVRHDPGTRLGTDPEDLHQLRVAVRRLRSYLAAAIPLLEPEWTNALRKELEWAGDFLNPVRDLDVMIPYFEREVALLEPSYTVHLTPLLAALSREREHSIQTMMEELESERYLTLLMTLEDATKSINVRPAGPSLRKVAAGNFRELRKAVRELGPEASDEKLHRIRILTKRARFAGELAARTGGKAVKDFVERAKQVQDVLGEHQDASVAEGRVSAFAENLSDARSAFASGRLAERQVSRKDAARADFPAAWRALERSGKKTWL